MEHHIMTKIKSGIIQMGLKGDTGMHPDQIRDLMLDAHLPLIDQAGAEGVQILCLLQS
jgi:beta-ureidopropionase